MILGENHMLPVVYFCSVLFYCTACLAAIGLTACDLMKFDLYPHLIASGESPGSKYTDTVTHASLLLSLPCFTVRGGKLFFCIHEDTINYCVRPFVWCSNGLTVKEKSFTVSLTNLTANEANCHHATVSFSTYEM